MMNLQDGLARIAGPGTEPTREQVVADLARGQKALRRRRTMQTAAGSAFAVAAVAAAFAFASGSPAATGTTPEAKAPVTSTATDDTKAPAFQLIAYKGKQPDAFTVAQVPAGYEVQGVTEGSLTVGPEGMADKDPNSFVGKVAVMLQSVDEHGKMPGTPEKVKVGDREGLFVKRPGSEGDGITLFIKQPSGMNLEIQVWDGVGWTRDQIVAFAEGVTVNANAKPGRG
jgi:hypothetical protein